MLNTLTYKVVEDNAGGLHLFVFEDLGDGDRVIYEHSGYEYNQGQLIEDMNALHQGQHPADWDGCEENPEQDWEHMSSQEHGYEVIAEHIYDYKQATSVTNYYPELMGLAGKNEFGGTE